MVIGVTAVMAGGAVELILGLDGWERQPRWQGRSEEEGKESQHPWRAQEGWKESSSGAQQHERCHAETLGSSEGYDRAPHCERCHAETVGGLQRRV